MSTETTFEEAQDQITGHDDLAVEAAFGTDMHGATKRSLSYYKRCVVFTHLRHQGVDDASAKNAALDLTMGQLADYFAPEPEEVDPEDPDTEVGKGSPALDDAPPS